jgi:hypothetical protein
MLFLVTRGEVLYSRGFSMILMEVAVVGCLWSFHGAVCRGWEGWFFRYPLASRDSSDASGSLSWAFHKNPYPENPEIV